MNCFACFSSEQGEREGKRWRWKGKLNHSGRPSSFTSSTLNNKWIQTRASCRASKRKDNNNKENAIAAKAFTFRDLATATKNFRPECLVGEGGFGRVYRGHLSNPQSRLQTTIAVKQLDRNGSKGNKEFLAEVLMLSLLHHPNLVNLIGYCADGDQRLLVYEFMPLGSLEDHLLDIPKEQRPLNWCERMKIALDAAKGLEYLHGKANPPVIYRDFKSSNILLGKDFHAKLSDFGLAKLGPTGDKAYVSTRVMGTYGYCAPEYQRGDELTPKSDVYSFGVVLLELITGRRAIDTNKPTHEQNLVTWAQSFLSNPTKYPELADPLLAGEFPEKELHQAVGIAAMCLQEEETTRPLMSDVVTALKFLSPSPQGDTSNHCFSPGTEYTECINHPNHDDSRDHSRVLSEAMEWGSHTTSRATSKNSSYLEV